MKSDELISRYDAIDYLMRGDVSSRDSIVSIIQCVPAVKPKSDVIIAKAIKAFRKLSDKHSESNCIDKQYDIGKSQAYSIAADMLELLLETADDT